MDFVEPVRDQIRLLKEFRLEIVQPLAEKEWALEVCEGYIQTDRTAGTTLICPAKDRLTMKLSDKLSEKLTET